MSIEPQTVIGTIERCEVVQLQDGNRAIEVIENYTEEGSDEIKYGYQLIMSFTSTKDFEPLWRKPLRLAYPLKSPLRRIHLPGDIQNGIKS